MDRITRLSNELTSKSKRPFIDDAIKFLNFDGSFFSEEINAYRMRLRKDLEKHVVPYLPDVIEKAEDIFTFSHVLKKHKVCENYISKPYGSGQDPRFLIATLLELGRIDASLATLHLVQNGLFANTIGIIIIIFRISLLFPDWLFL